MDLDKKDKSTKIKYLNYILITLVVLGFLIYINKTKVFTYINSLQKAQPANQKSEVRASDIPEIKKIVVDVEGGVINPGVYEIEEGKRIADVLLLAGGFSKDVDIKQAALNINKAQKLTDSMKIYIPIQGDSTATTQVKGDSNSTNSAISINNASKEQLNSLSGIGDATSQKIIDARPYSNIEELKVKKIISESLFEKIKSQITV